MPLLYLRRQQRLPALLCRPPSPAAPRLGNQKAVGAALDQVSPDRHGRPRHRGERAGQPHHAAGAAGPEDDQRPALCQLRHHERHKARAVHERPRPADGDGARRRRRRRPAPGAGPGLRYRCLRGAESVERLGECAGRPGHGAGRRQCRRSPTTSAAPRPASTTASTRASWSASASATPMARSGSNGFVGQGWTDSVSVAAYGSFTQARLLRRCAGRLRLLQQPAAAADLDPRPAAAHRQRQHRRQPVPGPGRDRLQVRLYAPAAATSRRSAGCRRAASNQNAFTEGGAQSLNLNVAQQTTNSLRTVFGADLGGAIGLGDRELDLALRLGWMHEFAYTGRPITAAFAGAPGRASPSTAPRRSATAR